HIPSRRQFRTKIQPSTVTITTTKPIEHQREPTANKNINNKLDKKDMNNPYKNLISGLISPEFNTKNLNLNMSNLNFINPAEQMKNQIITFIKTLINHIKAIINKIKL
ncbi:MAG: hypothetical protein PHY59_07405, partial [Methanobacterium sp.]|nr:hypothetical protein [Methanobacterium sp.]